jgi:hypothetical protein
LHDSTAEGPSGSRKPKFRVEKHENLQCFRPPQQMRSSGDGVGRTMGVPNSFSCFLVTPGGLGVDEHHCHAGAISCVKNEPTTGGRRALRVSGVVRQCLRPKGISLPAHHDKPPSFTCNLPSTQHQNPRISAYHYIWHRIKLQAPFRSRPIRFSHPLYLQQRRACYLPFGL